MNKLIQNKQTRPKTVSIDTLTRDFTDDDWALVAREKKYYKLVTSLRTRRQQIGLTQKQLAEKANLPRATIVKVESGTRNATLDTLDADGSLDGSGNCYWFAVKEELRKTFTLSQVKNRQESR